MGPPVGHGMHRADRSGRGYCPAMWLKPGRRHARKRVWRMLSRGSRWRSEARCRLASRRRDPGAGWHIVARTPAGDRCDNGPDFTTCIKFLGLGLVRTVRNDLTAPHIRPKPTQRHELHGRLREDAAVGWSRISSAAQQLAEFNELRHAAASDTGSGRGDGQLKL